MNEPIALQVQTRAATAWDELRPALGRLDAILDRAIEQARRILGEPSADPFRGLAIGPEEVARWQSREPGATWQAGEVEVDLELGPRLERLGSSLGLDAFDLDVVLVALAPEVDLKYERIYAYLQDDVSKKRPTVDLALGLLCASGQERLAGRSSLGPDGPLIRQGLLHVLPDPGQNHPPLLAHVLKLDDQFVDALCGQGGLDRRLSGFCRLLDPRVERTSGSVANPAVEGLARQCWERGEPLILHFQGAPGRGQRQSAIALAGALGAELLVADLARIPEPRPDAAAIARVVFREAQFQRAVLCLEGLDASLGVDLAAWEDALARVSGLTIVCSPGAWSLGSGSRGVLSLKFARPTAAALRECWSSTIAAMGAHADEDVLDDLADRFRLGPEAVDEAARAAWLTSRTRGGASDEIPRADLFAAARARSGHALGTLARKVEPRSTWDDLILPEDSLAQLRELCKRAGSRSRVLESWGFGKKLSRGKGVSALFAGPSGTGKTMAAEVIAADLGLDLCAIDLAGVVSKYIGETEKNLERIFSAAEDASAVLFFDEADALFGKRSEVRDAHDRYANIEISYLLQKIEHYEGVAILASNLRHNMDDAFTRRLAFSVPFPFPDEHDRRRIWGRVWPAETPLGDDVDFDLLAGRFKLSGGNIKNLALAAAYLAAGEDSVVRMSHLIRATRREYQKMGKTLTDEELNGEPAREAFP